MKSKVLNRSRGDQFAATRPSANLQQWKSDLREKYDKILNEPIPGNLSKLVEEFRKAEYKKKKQ